MQSQQEIKSFYIPRVYTETTEQYVKYIFNMSGIGVPYRVDFTPCGKKSGFREDTTPQKYKSAFVHFESFYDSASSVISFKDLGAGVFQTISYEPYWRILQNHNPVSQTMMNLHQVVANCSVLETKVEQLERDRNLNLDTISFMSDRISVLENQIHRLTDFVFDKVAHDSVFTNDEICTDKIDYENLDSNSVSTHSSMPSLEYIDTPQELSWDGPTPEEIETADVVEDNYAAEKERLDQVNEHLDESWLHKAIELVTARLKAVKDNNNSRERMRCSADLCGNE